MARARSPPSRSRTRLAFRRRRPAIRRHRRRRRSKPSAGDMRIHATKTGMLATAAIVEAVAAAIDELDLPSVVVDPVIGLRPAAHVCSMTTVWRRSRRELLPAGARGHAEYSGSGGTERLSHSDARRQPAGGRADSRDGRGRRGHHRWSRRRAPRRHRPALRWPQVRRIADPAARRATNARHRLRVCVRAGRGACARPFVHGRRRSAPSTTSPAPLRTRRPIGQGAGRSITSGTSTPAGGRCDRRSEADVRPASAGRQGLVAPA